jgi:superfamily II DNA helicase RecQ
MTDNEGGGSPPGAPPPPGILPGVPMADHHKLMQEHAHLQARYSKAVKIIDHMKTQVGQVNASLAEAEVDRDTYYADLQQANRTVMELQAKAQGIDIPVNT